MGGTIFTTQIMVERGMTKGREPCPLGQISHGTIFTGRGLQLVLQMATRIFMSIRDREGVINPSIFRLTI
jgi:hypothetical protein